MKSSRFAAVMCGVIVLTATMAGVARADQVDDPRYKAWANFKVDSNETLTATVERGAQKMTLNIKYTLKEVADDHVTLEVAYSMDVNGQKQEMQPVTQTINAKTDDDNVKEAGEEDVTAMGKTFKCKVFNYDKMPSSGPGGNNREVHAKIWASSDVPGGVVKIESAGGPPTSDGKPATTTLTLTAYEAK